MITLANKHVGPGHPPLIIAEAGINHNGDLEKAKDLISAAAEAGADIVKFQTHFPEDEMLRLNVTASYVGGSFYDLLNQTKLSKNDHFILKEYSEKKGVLFLSTPFCREAVDFLEELNVAAFKTGSGELTNIPLLVYIAHKQKPMIISTGMSELHEIEETLAAIRTIQPNFILMHCTSTYPTDYENINLGAIPLLSQRFQVPVGLSDHSKGIYTALGAVALGAVVIEKHFTLDRTWPGPDQAASIQPSELKQLVKGANAIFLAKGAEKKIIEAEKSVMHMARESVVSTQEIPEGTIIMEHMVWVKRPGIGIPAKDLTKVIGRRTIKKIFKNRLLSWHDLA